MSLNNIGGDATETQSDSRRERERTDVAKAGSGEQESVRSSPVISPAPPPAALPAEALEWTRALYDEIETAWVDEDGGYYLARWVGGPSGLKSDGSDQREAVRNLISATKDYMAAMESWGHKPDLPADPPPPGVAEVVAFYDFYDAVAEGRADENGGSLNRPREPLKHGIPNPEDAGTVLADPGTPVVAPADPRAPSEGGQDEAYHLRTAINLLTHSFPEAAESLRKTHDRVRANLRLRGSQEGDGDAEEVIADELLRIVTGWKKVYMGVPWMKTSVSIQGVEGAQREWANRASRRIAARLRSTREPETVGYVVMDNQWEDGPRFCDADWTGVMTLEEATEVALHEMQMDSLVQARVHPVGPALPTPTAQDGE